MNIIISGAGIVGLATAYTLLKNFPNLKLAILEKESTIAQHQTGHNSGVIHSGIYYKPGSFKAKNCVKGMKKLLEFCNTHQIPYDLCGKLIVATDESQIAALNTLYERGTQNGVEGLKKLNQRQLREVEPYSNGIEAILSPQTGIVDYKQVAAKLYEQILAMGGDVLLNHQVLKATANTADMLIQTDQGDFTAGHFINCSGLYADHIAKSAHSKIQEKIVPFRGEYYFLKPEKAHLLKGLIYPVPNPKFPFLGVHLTKRISGEVEIGPNAVLAFAKEGYKKRDINLKEMSQYLSYGGFWNMAKRHWKTGCYEMYRSFSKKAFVRDIQKLMPEIQEEDLIPGGSGVRAQAIGPQGQLVDDFLIKELPRQTHILNAPSPAATSCLAIAETILEQIKDKIDLPSKAVCAAL